MNIKMTAAALGVAPEQVVERMRTLCWLRSHNPWLIDGDLMVKPEVEQQRLAYNYIDGDVNYVLIMDEGLEALRDVAP